MTFSSVLRGFGLCISGFARMILFFASILFLGTSLVLILFLNQSKASFNLLDMSQVNTSLHVMLGLAIYLVCLAVVGVLGSFFGSKTSIEWFAFLASLNVILGIAVLMYTGPRLEVSHSDIQKRLEELQPKYDWAHKDTTDEAGRNATLIWDTIQRNEACCGLNSPDDWAPFRPAKGAEVYPLSCCKDEPGVGPDRLCRPAANGTGGLWESGCVKQLDSTNGTLSLMVTFMICFNMVLSVLACTVLLCKPRHQDHQNQYSY